MRTCTGAKSIERRRTLMNAWSKAGNYMADSKVKEGTQVLMMDVGTAIDYADRSLRITLATGLPELELLPWFEKKDRTTRAAMAKLVRQQWPAAEVLEKAWLTTQGDWQVVKGQQIVGVHSAASSHDAGLECDRAQRPPQQHPRRLTEHGLLPAGRVRRSTRLQQGQAAARTHPRVAASGPSPARRRRGARAAAARPQRPPRGPKSAASRPTRATARSSAELSTAVKGAVTRVAARSGACTAAASSSRRTARCVG